ncbi:TPA: 23S rRNA (uracil(1939)-C(5))-methyltransferase RlmD [Pasteurella multocida]|uniref:23S rRNA (uracil(1939)-C(5))-methyltransferase RlmD n=1 Tax=Pasteurella multocida TaxID=747 RepID=UPI00139767A6|nr:23S rRNA (uracil(1939)-C(5))-methyltransferase RlmD [Pasteurella multocida]MCL7791157.1 23S rRNA (uracil(1939)-C(5))-methyltransferase RlmD [Pasteurella multocida]MCL7796737.1 23S rRNA (uracil(1939)-C(5))-methyltransferase RlmD [Pasteurella multocida]MCL7800654.1 23S rRNA (uracil(1939)-C(5))-methyltransferase RlmD [Pasteurella multocida]MDG2540686.1 23S rRNA (uracil(1939)-C(5))-methyltransferase RlmD [Pasteurella multocida]QHZ97954.1 23S rRNA (uracil(1939)-C(5))-methyltransferase RlmD [Past
MVLHYTPHQSAPRTTTFVAEILDLDYQGRGVAKVQGKTWFIENALPQEKVEVRIVDEKRHYGHGISCKILTPHPDRQSAKCAYYAQCGGCQSQHIPIDMQRQAKQQALFQRLQQLQPQATFMPMIVAAPWHYRRRVRLSIRFHPKSKQLAMGLRQRNTQQIVNLQHCDVLEIPLSQLLPKLHLLFSTWSLPKNLGHVELVHADNGIAMLLRHTGNLAQTDRTLLTNFAQQENLMLFVQDDQQITQLHGEAPYYILRDGTKLQFDIRDFIQVNAVVNQKMIDTALEWLELTSNDNVLDLFCGMGNFTLPISRQVNQVVGIEGVGEMVEKAKRNAEQNQCDNVQFYQANLDQPFVQQHWASQHFNKILLDPPRTGAAFALHALCELGAEKILYVSCNPATLVRDTAILLQFNYRLKKVAMIDMFPNTGHLESISLFEKE